MDRSNALQSNYTIWLFDSAKMHSPVSKEKTLSLIPGLSPCAAKNLHLLRGTLSHFSLYLSKCYQIELECQAKSQLKITFPCQNTVLKNRISPVIGTARKGCACRKFAVTHKKPVSATMFLIHACYARSFRLKRDIRDTRCLNRPG